MPDLSRGSRRTARARLLLSSVAVSLLFFFLGTVTVLLAAEHRVYLPVMVSSSNMNQPTRVLIAAQASKISQLVGDYDRQRQAPTANLTWSRYQLASTDLGIPFRHQARTYLLFGDTNGARGGDAIAYTTDTRPEDGLSLDFVHGASGVYKPIVIPGVTQGAYDVPTDGVSVGGRMYLYYTTDATSGPNGITMGRSIVAVSDDDGQTFTYLYELSHEYFINVSLVQVDAGAWPGLPASQGQGLVMFGSGAYRRSDIYLSYQPSAGIGSPVSRRFLIGVDKTDRPIWGASENAAMPLFNQPCVGEFSVSYNSFIKKWIMLYNCASSDSRGIVLRAADQPWGPWSGPQLIFRPWEDQGYCHFMHTSWLYKKCDNVSDPGRENEWGGEYGPYQFDDFATGNSTSTTIYFTMSTWNPYTVVLMKAGLRAVPL